MVVAVVYGDFLAGDLTWRKRDSLGYFLGLRPIKARLRFGSGESVAVVYVAICLEVVVAVVGNFSPGDLT